MNPNRSKPRHETMMPIITQAKTSLTVAIKSSGRILLPIPGGYQCCHADEILYLKASSNYTEIHYADGSKRLLSKTLKTFEAVLPSHRFFRVHKTFVVNAAHITEIHLNTNENSLKLANGFMIPISRNIKLLFND